MWVLHTKHTASYIETIKFTVHALETLPQLQTYKHVANLNMFLNFIRENVCGWEDKNKAPAESECPALHPPTQTSRT